MSNPFKPWREINKPGLFLAMSLTLSPLLLLLSPGCASPNPSFNPAQPPSATNPQYVPNKTGTAILDTISAANAATAPANPYSIPIGIGVGAGYALLAWFAKSKTDQAAAAKATTAQIAASVAAQGPAVAQAVTDHASNTPLAVPVFAAINANLPPDKITTGTTT